VQNINISSAIILSLGLAACGGTGGEGAPVASKNDAAQATYRTQQTGDSLQDRQSQALVVAQEIPGINDNGVNATTDFEIDGTDGSAKVSLEAAITGGDVKTKYTIVYSNYSGNGVDYIDGTVVYTTEVSTSGAGASVSHTVKGTTVIWGTQAATLDMDTTLRVTAGAVGVSVSMDGQVIADGEAFAFDGDEFDLTAGTF
jgi:hypothetical protein